MTVTLPPSRARTSCLAQSVRNDWWHALDATDDTTLLADQVTGGGIAWGAGEFPVVLVALMVVRQWSRSEERAAKRYDRKADRDDDATLRAYNDQLARLNGTGTPRRES